MNLREMHDINASLQVLADPHTGIHFSQFGEDIIFWSLLQTFGMLGKPGFYVDVGALHPSFASNTKMLSLMGWRGLNIDANPDNIDRFREARPLDINIHAAISDIEEEVTFEIFDAAGVSTADPEARARNLRGGFAPVRSITQRTRLLRDVLAEHLSEGHRIDLMSIDVEGYDLRVLKSNDWQRFAPYFLMIEDHKMSLVDRPSTETFSFLKSLGYRLCSVAFVTSIYVRDQV